ncbi:MAG: FeoC-like transcriptional regulator [Chlorobium phaeobacteroides]|jgi:hypothetical protein|nr:FeoC-like transcriptional regulator [Chlorobium phaeobacteroides]
MIFMGRRHVRSPAQIQNKRFFMTLTDLKGFIQERRRVSLSEIAGYFKADMAMIESMLDHWIRKGRVQVKQADAFSASCCGKCGGHKQVWYTWVDG